MTTARETGFAIWIAVDARLLNQTVSSGTQPKFGVAKTTFPETFMTLTLASVPCLSILEIETSLAIPLNCCRVRSTFEVNQNNDSVSLAKYCSTGWRFFGGSVFRPQ